jgi:hypothetical protein
VPLSPALHGADTACGFRCIGGGEQFRARRLEYSPEKFVRELHCGWPAGLVADASADEYADYQGVRGQARRFTTSERILVTWFNRSDQSIRFTSRISFTDADEPDGGTSHGRWYTMRSAAHYRDTWTEIAPGQSAQTMFAIRNAGVHKTDSVYALVNINLAVEWGMSDLKQHLVCSSIELRDDADTQPPAAPTGLRVSSATDSKIQLAWDVPSDNTGVYDYLVYLNGEIEGYSRENTYTCVYLEADSEHHLTVTARDIMLNESAASAVLTARTLPYTVKPSVIAPSGVEYLGALRLPEDFNWGGEAVAYNPDGDGGASGSGASDGFAGSLFVTDVNQPEHGHVGEVGIPEPRISGTGDVTLLPVASRLQSPVNVRPPSIDTWDFVDIWRTGLEYHASEKRLYSSWSVHYTVTGEKHAGLSCTNVDGLPSSARYGPWYLGDPALPPIDAQFADYLFSIPDAWAGAHTAGRSMVVGRARDGGLSGLGPTLYAFSPVGSTPPAANTAVQFTTLLEYGSVEGTDNYHYPDAIDGYKHSDEWRGACWLGAGTQAAVAVVGRKAHGDNWYGYHGERMPHDWIIADVPYYAFDESDPDGKGWRAHRLRPMMMLFDPADLADVAAGTLPSHRPQPYAAIRFDEDIFFGAAREIFSTTYNGVHRLLYLTEFVREHEGALVIHVFRINAVPVGIAGSDVPEAPELNSTPNPFTSSTDITLTLPRAADVLLCVYDMLGRRVAVLKSGIYPAGSHRVRFDAGAQALSGGCYFAVLSVDGALFSRRLVYTK